MLHGRKCNATAVATLFALLIALLTFGPGLAGFDSASAKPDLQTVKKKVEKLEQQAEAASERYNDAQVKVAQTQTELTALNSDLKRQTELVGSMREQVAALVVEQFQGNALSTTSQLVLSSDPDAFLDNLNAVSTYNSQRGRVMQEYSTELDRLNLRKDAVQAESKRLRGLQRAMGEDKREIQRKADQAQALLDDLEAEARVKLLGGDYSGSLPTFSGSSKAAVALRYALAQVGKSYVYGATGPNAFDCSGLTMRAWGAAGVGLPHSSGAQQGSGIRVSRSQLAPGDLVFFYSPVSHVGIYLGNGRIVDAANPRTGVRISQLNSMPYAGAVRPG